MVLLIMVADYLGSESAQNKYQQFVDAGLTVEILHVEKGPLSGNPIVCSSTHCAYFISGSVSIYPLTDVKFINSKVNNSITKGSS